MLYVRALNRRHDVPLLFKYATADTAAAILATRALRWSSPLLFNDPFDVHRDFELPFSHATFADAVLRRVGDYVRGDAEAKTSVYRMLTAAIRSAIARGVPESIVWEDLRSAHATTIIPVEIARQEFRRIWSERVPGMRIVCFSSDPASPAMWAHYAGDLSGAVLGFESSDERDSPWLLAEPVIYQASAPTLPDAEVWARAMLGENEIAWDEFLREYYFAKSLDWAVEKEYRVPTDKKPSEEGLFSDWTFAPEDLREVRLGPKADEKFAQEVRDLVVTAYPHAKVVETVLNVRERQIVARQP
jgi:hypothetical protein